MQKELFKDLEKLGFGRALQEQVEHRLGLVGPHFTASEHRKIGGFDVKLLAHLTYDKKASQLAVRSYDVIDLTVRRPDLRRPLVTMLEQTMEEVNWNAKQFSWEHIASVGHDTKLTAETSRIEEALKNMTVFDVEGELEAQRLRLKYMYDSLYGHLNHLDGLNGFKYQDYFNMLTLDRRSGLLRVNEAVELLCEQNLNNYRPKEIIEAVIATRQRKAEQKKYPARASPMGDGDSVTVRQKI